MPNLVQGLLRTCYLLIWVWQLDFRETKLHYYIHILVAKLDSIAPCSFQKCNASREDATKESLNSYLVHNLLTKAEFFYSYRPFYLLVITMNLSPISNFYKQNSVSIFWPLDGQQNPQKCIKSIFRWYCKLYISYVHVKKLNLKKL